MTDATGGLDASLDAGALLDAGAPTDAGSADAGQDASTSTCGDLGKPCSSAGECGSGLACHASGVCLPASAPICGGFAGAECPASAPECVYCSGCDFGPCLTSAERACVCSQPGARTRFPDC